MIAAVSLSNVPEGLSAATGMKKAGHRTPYILGLWGAFAVVSALAAFFGYLFHKHSPPEPYLPCSRAR